MTNFVNVCNLRFQAFSFLRTLSPFVFLFQQLLTLVPFSSTYASGLMRRNTHDRYAASFHSSHRRLFPQVYPELCPFSSTSINMTCDPISKVKSGRNEHASSKLFVTYPRLFWKLDQNKISHSNFFGF